eukprot:scaffold5316_cov67-Phaeocystis_antarctica.AAC.2
MSKNISVNHSGSDSFASGGIGVILTASCSPWATTRCRATLTPVAISGLARAGRQPKVSCSACISSISSSSAMKAASSAAVISEPSSNPEVF